MSFPSSFLVTICSIVPLLSKSLIHIFIGFFSEVPYAVLVPLFPNMRSLFPSPSKSAASTVFHHPVNLSRSDLILESLRPVFLNNAGDPQSETVTRSFFPSLSISVQMASVIIPASLRSYPIRSVAFEKVPSPLFSKNK